MNRWGIVHECDAADGSPTEWSIMVSDGVFYWIDLLADGTYDVIDQDCHTVLKNCKSLPSAKQWVKNHLL